jgi:Icc-related predicted phosphoesterase
MKIVAISDTHLQPVPELPSADMLILAGDVLNSGSLKELHKFLAWLATVREKYTHCLYVPGNHDKAIERLDREAMLSFFQPLATQVLINQQTTIESIKFYGFPYVPYISGHWAFECLHSEDGGRHQMQRLLNAVPTEGIDVFISHGPVKGVLASRWGCPDLLNTILRLQPKVFVCGHIHEEYGTKEFNGMRFYNVAVCDEKYRPVNAPTVFEI